MSVFDLHSDIFSHLETVLLELRSTCRRLCETITPMISHRLNTIRMLSYSYLSDKKCCVLERDENGYCVLTSYLKDKKRIIQAGWKDGLYSVRIWDYRPFWHSLGKVIVPVVKYREFLSKYFDSIEDRLQAYIDHCLRVDDILIRTAIKDCLFDTSAIEDKKLYFCTSFKTEKIDYCKVRTRPSDSGNVNAIYDMFM